MSSQRKHFLWVFLTFSFGGIFVAFFVWFNARITADQQTQYLADQARYQAEAHAYYLSLTPLEAFEYCRDRWNAEQSWSHYYIPQAVAYSRAAVDAYYFQGVDTLSLRHFRCTAEGETYRGFRYQRFGMEHLPAEVGIEPQAQDHSIDWTRDALGKLEVSADFFAAEFYMAPDWVLLTRTWRGAETLQSHSTPEARDFPILLALANDSIEKLLQDPTRLNQASALLPLNATNWSQQPQAAFALLRRELPVDAKILTLRLSADEIDITIAGPIKGFDNDPPSPSGDMEYDEYGIADRSWWYPRPLFENDCKVGQSLQNVIAEFERLHKANDSNAVPVYRCGWKN
jgi:hypothetical protein